MLPNSFCPQATAKLMRLGKSNDGGYIVDENSIKETQLLLSFGINDDWSFEKEFYHFKPIPIIAYDGTVNLKFWLKAIIKNLANVLRFKKSPACLFKTIYKAFNFCHFFKKPKKAFYSKMIGKNENNCIDLKTILKKFKISNNVFLKVDIEGSEYDILPQILECQGQLSGLVIEFHDINIHREKISQFINTFKLELVHLHANNYGGIDISGDPRVVEATFSKTKPSADVKKHSKLPIKQLDQPNNPEKPEIILQFENVE